MFSVEINKSIIQTVSQCPCWIEISLNEPLAWLDAALRELKDSSSKHDDLSFTNEVKTGRAKITTNFSRITRLYKEPFS